MRNEMRIGFRAIRLAAVAAALLLGLVLPGIAQANGVLTGNPRYMYNELYSHLYTAHDYCLDARLQNAGVVQLYQCLANQTNQHWDVETQLTNGNGHAVVTVDNDYFHTCLFGDYPASNGTPVTDVSCDGGRYELWQVNPGDTMPWNPPDGSQYGGFESYQGFSGQCLDADANPYWKHQNPNGAKIQVWSCNGQKQQGWGPH